MVFSANSFQLEIVFGLLEEWQHIVVGPARIALSRPIVVVLTVAAYIHHAIHHRCAAQDLAAWPIAALLHGGQARHRLRLCVVAVVNVAANEVQEHGGYLSAHRLIATCKVADRELY